VNKLEILPGATGEVVASPPASNRPPTFEVWRKGDQWKVWSLKPGTRFTVLRGPYKVREVSGQFVDIEVEQDGQKFEFQTFYVHVRYDARTA